MNNISKLRNYTLDEDVFHNITSKEQAYIHGFICADGYINNNSNQIYIELSDKDVKQLNKIKEFFKIDKDIIKYRTKEKDEYHNKERIYKYCILEFYSKQIISDFYSYINTTNKTFELELPKFQSEELTLAWVKGYYDGDGCENLPRLYSANKQLLIDISKFLNIDISPIDCNSNVFSLYLGKNILFELTSNYSDGLERKNTYSVNKNMSKSHKKLDFLTYEILSSIIQTHSLAEIGKMFDISRSSVFAKCKQLNIVIPKRKNNKYTKSKIKYNCKYYPCHKGKFESCEWCYCPLYQIKDCKGNFAILPNGVKDCSKCLIPHYNYNYIIDRLKEINIKNSDN